jgi:hypothetical protein
VGKRGREMGNNRQVLVQVACKLGGIADKHPFVAAAAAAAACMLLSSLPAAPLTSSSLGLPLKLPLLSSSPICCRPCTMRIDCSGEMTGALSEK